MPDRLRDVTGFFIVGAPRCGTTFLSKMLASNPQICFSKPKEPHYFTLFAGGQTDSRLRAHYYNQYFPHFSEHHRAWGEGSVSYLYSAEAIKEVINNVPRAKFVVNVRNPIDMVYSHYARLLYLMDEEVEDFSLAWALQGARAEGRHIPRRCRDPRLLRYAEVGRLGHYVEQLLSTAGPERCFVVVYDDLVRDPLAVYKGVLDFIGVDDDGRTSFAKERGNKTFKSKLIQRLVYNPPRPIHAAVQRLQSHDRAAALVKRVRRRLKRANTVRAERKPLSPDTRETLRRTFEEDVRKLSSVLRRDLSHWI